MITRFSTIGTLAIAFALLAPTLAVADAAPPATQPLTGPEEALITLDPDGGRTIRLLLEDGVGGTYSYVVVNLSNTHETAGAFVGIVNAGVGQTVAGTPEPIREAGAFVHQWTHDGSPMTTVGLYAIHQSEGMLRAPVVIFENVTSDSDLVAQATALVLNEGTDVALNAAPFLLEYAVPELSAEFTRWPFDASRVDTFRDYPRVYAWTVRKASPAGEVWEGAYLERLGSWSGGFTSADAFEGRKIIEVGNALRVDATTMRVAGAYLQADLEKRPGDPQTTRERLTVGAAGDATGRIPLAGVELEDERSGPHQFTYPGEQRSGFAVGAYVAGEWTPLIGSWTDVEHVVGANGDVEQTRITSVGAYALGDYVPLAGTRYHGDRSTTTDWALRFVAGGTLGSHTMGDWEIDVGTFRDGAFVPVAGATYADDFADAFWQHQAMMTAGVHGLDGYVPLVGATYDGERPFLTWLFGWTGGNRANTLDWMVSTGTFIEDRYTPILGVRFDNRAPEGTRTYQEQYTVGTFLLSYRAFIPLAGAAYDGDQQHLAWAAGFALGGTLGAPVKDFDAAGGVYVLGTFRPVLEVRYRHTYDADWPSQSQVTVGTRDADGAWTPLVRVTYSSTAPLVTSLNAPTDIRDDTHAQMTAGVFVQGDYVPLVAVENNEDRASVGVLPPYE